MKTITKMKRTASFIALLLLMVFMAKVKIR